MATKASIYQTPTEVKIGSLSAFAVKSDNTQEALASAKIDISKLSEGLHTVEIELAVRSLGAVSAHLKEEMVAVVSNK